MPKLIPLAPNHNIKAQIHTFATKLPPNLDLPNPRLLALAGDGSAVQEDLCAGSHGESADWGYGCYSPKSLPCLVLALGVLQVQRNPRRPPPRHTGLLDCSTRALPARRLEALGGHLLSLVPLQIQRTPICKHGMCCPLSWLFFISSLTLLLFARMQLYGHVYYFTPE